MEQISLQAEDTLYILGDVVDRYPGGIAILEEIIESPNMKMLLGNHEHMMLNAIYPYEDGLPWRRNPGLQDIRLWYGNNGLITEKELNKLDEQRKERIFHFLKSLPLNIDIEVNGAKYKLVHAVPVEFYNEEECSSYLDQVQYAVWERRFDFDKLPGTYTMIFGHTPTCDFSEDKVLSIWRSQNKLAIGIDCGSGFDAKESYWVPYQGRLACLRLDDMKEFYSEEGDD
jgi:serine/threonine protein phosphatase 1